MRDESNGAVGTGPQRLPRPVRRWLLQISLIGLLHPALAGAAGLAEPDTRAVRSVIEAQLQAFAASDAERAFSYASTAIRAQFGDATTFMNMVQSRYPMLIRPAAVSFFQPTPAEGAQGGVWQRVQFRDRAGRLWLATYQLHQQSQQPGPQQGHTGWRINGCTVVADSAKSST